MSEATLKIELDTTECQKLIQEAKDEIGERMTYKHALMWAIDNVELIYGKPSLSAVHITDMAEIVHDYVKCLVK
ncbi:hypothetical protein MUK70_11935 [Dyadobacter chenwenxiniae]|uniref:Uncharacterized protein n=1 Tax=Dyadobacter chenwenxiniae TaxID=2906456 RepID=A0A9X1TCD3_9BACT|nr:hypothetical protein [Dyadobacter chenwenxiniae]MCF0059952.1 hypothetical protein [Dyadobacter chenwenxiniae]UON85691.1 hypothetical protein MUK70_11935 [Dyadobacter chenwenxiniae]